MSQIEAREILEHLGFPAARCVRGRESVADMFPSGKRHGIYVIHCSNDEYYVGKATDVTRRYVQHKKTHTDIKSLSFKPVRKDRLDDEEQKVIWALEAAGIYLRNIALTSIPHGASDFDLVMAPEEQERWLCTLGWEDLRGDRVEEPYLRRKYGRKYERFKQMPYAEEVTEVLREYVRSGIPAVRRGEISFWNCSCLPSYRDPACVVYFRVNVNWQEVFSAYTVKRSPGLLFFSWQLARSPLEGVLGKTFVRHYPVVGVQDPIYKPGGQDQINIIAQGVGPALTLIRDHNILSAIRLFNLRLLKKGPCAYGRYHCLDLVDDLI